MRKPEKKLTMKGIAELIGTSQKQTVRILDKRIKNSFESLAQSVATGFAGADKRFNEMDNRIDDFEAQMTQQITGLNNRFDDLALNRATREELLVLDKRVGRIEHKLGIDFKKTEHV